MRDPARAVLNHVLLTTLEKRRFPLEARVRRLTMPHVVDRLVDDGRYLARVPVVTGDGPASRLAVTTLGIHAAHADESREEVQGLARTYECLAAAVRARTFTTGRVSIETLRRQFGAGLPLRDFRRWCTLLCSPRLQGRYLHDRFGYCGESDANGRADNRTGLFTELRVARSFLKWRGCLDPPETPAFLLSEQGLRVELGEHREVHVRLGTAELSTLPASMPAHALAALIECPDSRHHSLDLQAQVDADEPLCEFAPWGSGLATYLREQGAVSVDLAAWSSTEISRLESVLRRIALLDSVAPGKGRVPRFARGPDAHRQTVLARVLAALAKGPLRAEFPIIKNATRSVTRGVKQLLDELFNDGELAPFKADFQIGEWSVYRPTAR